MAVGDADGSRPSRKMPKAATRSTGTKAAARR
jgi:hypothetical protein